MQHSGWRGPFWASLLGLLAKPFCDVDLWDIPGRSPIGQHREVVSPSTSLEVFAMDIDHGVSSQDWAESSETDVTSEVLKRAYSTAVMSGVQEGSAARSSTRSAQPAICRYEEAALENATANNELPSRPCSLYFKYAKTSFDMRSLMQDVKNCGISLASVRCIQKVSADAYNITFTTPGERKLFYEKSECVYRSTDPIYSVFVYDAPFELPDDALAHRLSQYGDVKKIIRRTHLGYGRIETGVRIAKMVIHDPIPSFLRFGRRLIRLFHRDQVPTCRKCNQPGHEAKSCTNRFCFNCERIGHEAPDCTHDIRCSICKTTGHFASKCQYTWPREHNHRDAPVDDRPGTSLSSDAQESQPAPPVSGDVPEVSSPPLLESGSSSSPSSTGSSGSSPSSSSSQPSPQRMDNDDDDKDTDDDDGDDNDDGDNNMDDDTQPGAEGMDDSTPAKSPTHSEELMINAATAYTQNNTDDEELPEEPSTAKRPASSPSRKSRLPSKKKR